MNDPTTDDGPGQGTEGKPVIDALAVPTRAELRALRHAAPRLLGGPHRPRKQSSRAPDEALLDLVAEPFNSVVDARERLQGTEAHFRELGDRRAVFLTVYAAMTAHVEAGIESGTFEDAAWVRRYLVDFANRYRRVLVDVERGNWSALPEPWRIAFGASTGGDTLLIQDALLGINAHINYDLPYSLRDVGIDPDRPAKRRDHDRINMVLERLVDIVQRSLTEVYDAEGYRTLDTSLGSLDEQFTLLGLREARWLAWRNAVGLVEIPWALAREAVHWRIRAVATGAAGFILAPSADPTVLQVLRQVERDEPPLAAALQRFGERVDAVEFQNE